MFAVIKTGGRQFRVVPDDVLEIGKIAGDVGTIVQLGEVLVVGGDTPVLGMPSIQPLTSSPPKRLRASTLEDVDALVIPEQITAKATTWNEPARANTRP